MIIRDGCCLEESLYKHSVSEMANMGTTHGGITIKVFSGDGTTPHLHFIIDETHQPHHTDSTLGGLNMSIAVMSGTRTTLDMQ